MKKNIYALAAFTLLSFAACSSDNDDDNKNGGGIIENGKPSMKPKRQIKQIVEVTDVDDPDYEYTGIYDFVYASNGDLVSYSLNEKLSSGNYDDFIKKKEVYYEKTNNSIIENSTLYQESSGSIDRNEKVKINHILNDKGYIIKSITDNNMDRSYEYNDQNRLSSAEAFDGSKNSGLNQFSFDLNYNKNNCIDQYNYRWHTKGSEDNEHIINIEYANIKNKMPSIYFPEFFYHDFWVLVQEGAHGQLFYFINPLYTLGFMGEGNPYFTKRISYEGSGINIDGLIDCKQELDNKGYPIKITYKLYDEGSSNAPLINTVTITYED